MDRNCGPKFPGTKNHEASGAAMPFFGWKASVYRPPIMGMLGQGLRQGEDTRRNLKTLSLFISDFASLHAFIARKSCNVEVRGNLLNNLLGKIKGFRFWQTWIQISVQAFWTVGKTLFSSKRIRDIK